MTHHDEYLELAAAYALEALDEESRRRFESHMASGCAICERAIQDARDAARELLYAVDPVAPAAHVKSRLLASVRGDRAAAPSSALRPARHFWLSLAAAASLVLAVGLAFHTRSLLQATEREGSERQRVEAELKELEKSVDFFAGPMTQAVALEGRGSAREARAKAFLDAENGRLLLYVYDLPPLPSDRTYQLWVLLDGSPLSAGTFSVDADGSARLDPAPLPRLSGDITVAITVEPAGGVPQPTGPMVLMGS